ncbi:hypothetical protein ACPXB5_11315 [Micromonospora arida]|uniref:hypothetical protein n=1 Tax=Micromonospora arida TaxID=2203715 RepID=UPI003CE8CFBE
MGAAVGYATLPIIPSARGFARRLQKEIGNPTAKVAAEVGADMGAEMGESASKPLAARLGDGLRRHAARAVSAPSADAGKVAGAAFAKSMIETVDADIKAGFKRDANGRWRDANGRFAAAGDEGGRRFVLGFSRRLRGGTDAVSRFAQTVTRTAAKGLGRVGSAIGRAVGGAALGGLGLLRSALTSVLGLGLKIVPAFAALPSLLLAAGGAAGALTTLLAGGVASVGVLALGFRGVGDALGEVAEEGKASKETLKGLSKNARSFVREFERLQKPLGKLRRAVQDKLFAGLDKSMRSLAKRWLPALKPMLGDLATRFNKFGKTIFTALGKPDFVKNIREAVKGFGGFIDGLSASAKPFIDSLGRLSKASVPFVKAAGDGLARMSERFAKWVADGEKTGKLDTFMKDAVQAFRDIKAVGGSVIGIAREIYTTFFPDTSDASESFLSSVRTNLEKFRAWLADPANKQKIRDFITDVKSFLLDVKNLVADLKDIATNVDQTFQRVSAWGQRIKGFAAVVVGAFGAVGSAAVTSSATIRGAFGSLTKPVSDAIASFGRFKAGAATQFRAAVAAARALPGQIVGALSGLRAALHSAGVNAVRGLAAGIRSSRGIAEAAAAAVSAGAAAAARAAIKVKSPSRVMMEVGRFFTAGFVSGMVGGAAEVKSTSAKIAGMAYKAFRDKGLSTKTANKRVGSLLKALTPRQNQLNSLAKKWDSVASKLTTARAKLADALKLRDDFAAGVRDSAISRASIAGIAAGTPALLLEKMRAGLAETKEFASVLAELRKRGLNDTSYRQFAEAGVDSLGNARALLAGGAGAVSEVNAIQSQLNSVAASLGKSTSSSLYQAGVNAAAGLVKGLESQQKAIESLMTRIAKSMTAAIKKALGIKSPSRVFAKLGGFVGAGMALGVDRSRPKVTKAVGALVAVPDAPRAPRTPPTASPAGSTHYHLHNGRATVAQLEALQRRQAVLAHIGRPR